MDYEHSLTVTRASGSDTSTTTFDQLPSQDSVAAAKTIYDGPSDQQDTLTERDRSRLGDVDTTKHLKAFLPSYAPPAQDFRSGDRAETAFGPGMVVGTRSIDHLLYIRLDTA